jgi:hypothetical protein
MLTALFLDQRSGLPANPSGMLSNGLDANHPA